MIFVIFLTVAASVLFHLLLNALVFLSYCSLQLVELILCKIQARATEHNAGKFYERHPISSKSNGLVHKFTRALRFRLSKKLYSGGVLTFTSGMLK